jgi:uncharacterized protein (TIGR00162 family)
MEKPYLRELANPALDNPTFIQGLPGFGNVGRIAAQLLIKNFKAKPFAELYSPSFPDYVSVSSKGICHLPHYDFYSATVDDKDFIIMTGETQPSFDDVLAHYHICKEIVDYIEKRNCNFLITIGGVPIAEEKAKVYVASTTHRLAREFAEKGATIYSRGKIVGGTGLTLALAKERGLEGVCLLGATTGFKADRNAGFATFKFLMEALGKEIKEGLQESH